MSKNYTAEGDVYGALLDANKQRVSGYVKLGNAYPFTLEAKIKTKQQKSAELGKRGQIVDSGGTLDGVTGSLSLTNWIAANFAMLAAGKAVERTEAEGTVSALSMTLPADGSWIPTGHKDISAVLIADKVEGTDFEVSPRIGMVRALGDTALTADVAFSFAAGTGFRIEVGTNPVIRMAIMIDGRNTETNEFFTAEAGCVVFTSKSPINLISDPETDYEKMEFDLTFETPAGATSPCTIDGFPL